VVCLRRLILQHPCYSPIAHCFCYLPGPHRHALFRHTDSPGGANLMAASLCRHRLRPVLRLRACPCANPCASWASCWGCLCSGRSGLFGVVLLAHSLHPGSYLPTLALTLIVDQASGLSLSQAWSRSRSRSESGSRSVHSGLCLCLGSGHLGLSAESCMSLILLGLLFHG
jgi:hypothetical protein